MLNFPANSEIFVTHTPVSFGCGIDGMCRLCRIILGREPADKAYFLFVNKRKEQCRVLWYDGQGFSLCTKRLSKGKFQYWPKPGDSGHSIVTFFQAQVLIACGDPSDKKFAPLWKNIA